MFRADDRGEFRVEHLAHHHQPSSGRERQQPLPHRAGDIGQRDGRFQRQTRQHRRRPCGVVIFTTGTFFMGDPFSFECLGGPPNPASNGRTRGGITTSLQQTPGVRPEDGVIGGDDDDVIASVLLPAGVSPVRVVVREPGS